MSAERSVRSECPLNYEQADDLRKSIKELVSIAHENAKNNAVDRVRQNQLIDRQGEMILRMQEIELKRDEDRKYLEAKFKEDLSKVDARLNCVIHNMNEFKRSLLLTSGVFLGVVILIMTGNADLAKNAVMNYIGLM